MACAMRWPVRVYGANTKSAPARRIFCSEDSSAMRAESCKFGFRVLALRITNRLSASDAQRGDQSLGARDSHVAQRLVPAGIGQHRQHAGFHRALHSLFVVVDHYEGSSRLSQFLGRAASHPAETAQDNVAFQFVDHVPHTPLSEELIQLQLDQGLGHRADRQKDRGHAKEDEKRVEDPPGVAQPANFRIPDRGHGGQRHVEGIEHRIVFDQHEADGPAREHQRQGDRNQDQPAPQMTHGIILRCPAVSGRERSWPRPGSRTRPPREPPPLLRPAGRVGSVTR